MHRCGLKQETKVLLPFVDRRMLFWWWVSSGPWDGQTISRWSIRGKKKEKEKKECGVLQFWKPFLKYMWFSFDSSKMMCYWQLVTLQHGQPWLELSLWIYSSIALGSNLERNQEWVPRPATRYRRVVSWYFLSAPLQIWVSANCFWEHSICLSSCSVAPRVHPLRKRPLQRLSILASEHPLILPRASRGTSRPDPLCAADLSTVQQHWCMLVPISQVFPVVSKRASDREGFSQEGWALKVKYHSNFYSTKTVNPVDSDGSVM